MYGSIDLATSGTDCRLIPFSRPARYGGSRSTERRSHTSRHQAARAVTDIIWSMASAEQVAWVAGSEFTTVTFNFGTFWCLKTVVWGSKMLKIFFAGLPPRTPV